MKPNIAFLRKVEVKKVYRYESYSPRTGSVTHFRGGETTARRHADAGYIIMPGYPGVMRSSYATLTNKGREVLADAAEAEAPHA